MANGREIGDGVYDDKILVNGKPLIICGEIFATGDITRILRDVFIVCMRGTCPVSSNAFLACSSVDAQPMSNPVIALQTKILAM